MAQRSPLERELLDKAARFCPAEPLATCPSKQTRDF